MEFLKLSDLEGLTEEQIELKMSPMIQRSFAPPNGSVDFLAAKISGYEQAYNMPSDEMLSKVSSGQLQETQAFADWAIDYSLLKDMSSATVKNFGEAFSNAV